MRLFRGLNAKATAVLLIVLIEIGSLFYLGRNVYQKHTKSFLAMFSVTPITRDSLVFPKDSSLEHFYDLKVESGKQFSTPLPSGARYHINSDGLHDRFDYAVPKPRNTFRIITLGDSWTLGPYVNTEDNYSEVLEDALNQKLDCKDHPHFEVLNFGVYGYDIEYAIEKFKRKGLKYQPDAAVFLIKEDDLILSAEMARERSEAYKITPDGSIADSPSSSIAAEKKAFEELYSNETHRQQAVQRQIKSLGALNNYFNGRVLLLFMTLDDQERKILEQFSRSREGIHIHHKSALTNDERVPYDGHPNQKGHAAIAQSLFDYFAKEFVSRCNSK